MTNPLAVMLAFVVLLSACSTEGPHVVLESAPGPPAASEVARIEAALRPATDVVFLGTVTRDNDTATLVTFTDEHGEACASVFSGTGYSTACGGLEAIPESVIVLQTGNRSTTGLVVVTSPDITEIRVATGSGDTYAAHSLGPFSYIAFDNDRSGYQLSLVAGNDVVHTE